MVDSKEKYKFGLGVKGLMIEQETNVLPYVESYFFSFLFFATDLKAVSETPFCDHSIGKQ